MGTAPAKKVASAPAKAQATASPVLSSNAWAVALLHTLQAQGYKAPVTTNNISNIQRVITAESAGNTAGFLRDNNPFDLNTYTAPHSSLPNGKIVNEFGVNVQVFNTVGDGLIATANQIAQSPALLGVLRTSAPAPAFGAALSKSAWKSAGYANAKKFPTIIPANLPGANPGDPTGWWGQWVEPLFNHKGYIPIPGGGIIPLPVNPVQVTKGAITTTKGVVSGVTSVGSFLGKITNPTNLKNVGIFAAGLALAVTGLVIFMSSTKEGKQAATAAVEVG